MEESIKEISEGGAFMAFFNNVTVERCYYINAAEERVEKTSILSDATANMMRVFPYGPIIIKVFDNNFGMEFPLAKFKITSAFYHKDERAEVSQTSIMRGNEIIEELPITHGGFEDGKITLFMISKQKGKTVACILVNPNGIDNYYYRIIFTQ